MTPSSNRSASANEIPSVRRPSGNSPNRSDSRLPSSNLGWRRRFSRGSESSAFETCSSGATLVVPGGTLGRPPRRPPAGTYRPEARLRRNSLRRTTAWIPGGSRRMTHARARTSNGSISSRNNDCFSAPLPIRSPEAFDEDREPHGNCVPRLALLLPSSKLLRPALIQAYAPHRPARCWESDDGG